ncbi:MAG: hypothetical protein LBI58_03725, partial [Tannerellaceae bacterium]|nr:hypothetical protein [Tannerellaceae bacterium]
MKRTDWLPSGREKFHGKVGSIVDGIEENLVKFGMEEGAAYGDWYRLVYKPLYDEYLPAYGKWYDLMTRTPYVSTELA